MLNTLVSLDLEQQAKRSQPKLRRWQLLHCSGVSQSAWQESIYPGIILYWVWKWGTVRSRVMKSSREISAQLINRTGQRSAQDSEGIKEQRDLSRHQFLRAPHWLQWGINLKNRWHYMVQCIKVTKQLHWKAASISENWRTANNIPTLNFEKRLWPELTLTLGVGNGLRNHLILLQMTNSDMT